MSAAHETSSRSAPHVSTFAQWVSAVTDHMRETMHECFAIADNEAYYGLRCLDCTEKTHNTWVAYMIIDRDEPEPSDRQNLHRLLLDALPGRTAWTRLTDTEGPGWDA